MKSYFSLLFFISILSFSGLQAAAVPHSFSNGSVANADHINENFNAISANVTHLENEFNTISDNIASLNGLSHSLSTLGGKLTTHSDLIVTAQNNLIQLISKDVQIDNEIAVISGNISSITHELDNISDNINNLNALDHNVTVLEGNLTTHNDLIVTAQNNLIQLISKDVQIENEIAVISSDITSINHELSIISGNISNLNGLNHDITDITGKMIQISGNIENVKAGSSTNLFDISSQLSDIAQNLAQISGNLDSFITSTNHSLVDFGSRINLIEHPVFTSPPTRLTLPSASGNHFGRVAVDGNKAIVGAPTTSSALGVGVVYFYRWDGSSWVKEQEIYGDHGDMFGSSVAMSENSLIVGAPFDDDMGFNAGAAYFYHYNGDQWVFDAKVTPSILQNDDTFGDVVAIHNDKAIIGAKWDDGHGGASGCAYLYHKNSGGWTFQEEINGGAGSGGYRFGNSVGIHNDWVIVGAPEASSVKGKAYFFKWDGSSWDLKKEENGSSSNDYFGAAVSIHHHRCIVGAPGYGGKGRVMLYSYDEVSGNWVYNNLFDGTSSGEDYGSSVSINGDTAIAGAPGDDQGGENAGAVNVYQWDGTSWTNTFKIIDSAASPSDRFGTYSSIKNGVVIIGNFESAGAVLINPIQHHGSSMNSGGLIFDSTGGTGAFPREFKGR